MPPATEAEVMEAERIEAEQIPSDSGKVPPPTDSKDGPPPVPESAAKQQGTDGDIHPGVASPAPYIVAPLADPPVVAGDTGVVAGDTGVNVTPPGQQGTSPTPIVSSAVGPTTVDNDSNAGGSGDISAPGTSGLSKTLPCEVPKSSQDWFDEMSEVEQSKKRPASDDELDDGSLIRPNLRWTSKRRTLSLDRLADTEHGCPVSDNLEC